MVQALVDISEHSNRVLNIVKAKYGLKDKSAAIDVMAEQYEESLLEPALKPEYVQKAAKIQQQKSIAVGTLEALRKRHER